MDNEDRISIEEIVKRSNKVKDVLLNTNLTSFEIVCYIIGAMSIIKNKNKKYFNNILVKINEIEKLMKDEKIKVN